MRLKGSCRSDRGTSTLEAVLIIPVVMFLLLVGVQCALWAHAAQTVQVAASEGDLAARLYGGSIAQGAARARAVLEDRGADVSASSVQALVVPGGLARVTVAGQAVSILPGFSLHVAASDVGTIQEFRGSE